MKCPGRVGARYTFFLGAPARMHAQSCAHVVRKPHVLDNSVSGSRALVLKRTLHFRTLHVSVQQQLNAAASERAHVTETRAHAAQTANCSRSFLRAKAHSSRCASARSLQDSARNFYLRRKQCERTGAIATATVVVVANAAAAASVQVREREREQAELVCVSWLLLLLLQ